MEQDHAVRRREETKRIRLEQDRDYARFQEQLKLMKKEVSELGRDWGGWGQVGCIGPHCCKLGLTSPTSGHLVRV